MRDTEFFLNFNKAHTQVHFRHDRESGKLWVELIEMGSFRVLDRLLIDPGWFASMAEEK